MDIRATLKAWLSHTPELPPPPPLPEPDAQLALGALLVRIAKADHAYLFEELEQIDRILADRNGIGPVEAAKMRATCERLDDAFPETPTFVALIRDAVSYEERRAIVDAMWRVVLADGIEQDQEVELVHLIEEQLGVEAQHSAEARALAESIR
ncbi:tellurite resistance TerB family protein [Roseobacteraceae bacterium S113]